LRSGCRVQVKAVIIPPIIQIGTIIFVIEELISENSILIRIRPYLPNFSKIPAKAIDPATGASTWALGSHKWVPYKGILAINADIRRIHHTLGNEVGIGEINDIMFRDDEFLLIIRIPISKGKEAVTV
jgi:hypothetical protein